MVSKVGLEPLGCEQRLRELGLSSPEQGRLRGSSSQPGSASQKVMENTEPGFSPGILVGDRSQWVEGERGEISQDRRRWNESGWFQHFLNTKSSLTSLLHLPLTICKSGIVQPVLLRNQGRCGDQGQGTARDLGWL